MEILNQFGFEPVLFVAQIVNFLILAFIFKRFLYKPIIKVLQDRKKTIAKGLADAEAASADRAAAEEQREKIIKKAGIESEKILDDTKKAAEALREKVLTDTKAEAEKIMNEARRQADLQMEDMEKRAKKASLENSVAMLEKVMDKMFTKDEREKILTRSIKTLKGEN